MSFEPHIIFILKTATAEKKETYSMYEQAVAVYAD
jgi:hypothetical protein